ncbi:MAG: diaminopimelate epimerase [Actinobacteria bacterium]|nr:diaminopimelate epimerase [Actinomycetota bacterium]
MRFAKWHGIGNDFVMIADPDDRISLDAAQVKTICDRRFGVGADGVIRVSPARPTDDADLFMDYVNSDGTLGEMCGNGIRCLALFAREEGLSDKSQLKVSTRAGVKVVTVLDDGRVRVDMGPPIFEPAKIPMAWDGTDALHAKLELESEVVEATVLSMGNPHAVLFVDDPAAAPITTIGPAIETLPVFPNGTNVEWARVDSSDHVTMTVWERGSGQTLACGTGACAVAVAAKLIGGSNENVIVSLPGGDVEVEWAGSLDDERPVFLTGPAEKSFTGEL